MEIERINGCLGHGKPGELRRARMLVWGSEVEQMRMNRGCGNLEASVGFDLQPQVRAKGEPKTFCQRQGR